MFLGNSMTPLQCLSLCSRTFISRFFVVTVKPYWITRPTDESVLLGSQKIVSCQGGGTPSPNITWKIATG